MFSGQPAGGFSFAPPKERMSPEERRSRAQEVAQELAQAAGATVKQQESQPEAVSKIEAAQSSPADPPSSAAAALMGESDTRKDKSSSELPRLVMKPAKKRQPYIPPERTNLGVR